MHVHEPSDAPANEDRAPAVRWYIGTVLALVATIDCDEATPNGLSDLNALTDFLVGRTLDAAERVAFFHRIRALLVLQDPRFEQYVEYGPMPSDMVAGWVAARAGEFGEFVALHVPTAEVRERIGFRRSAGEDEGVR